MIGIIDYGLGNLQSIKSKLAILGHAALVSQKKADLENSSHLILPGVGHFAVGMKNIRDRGLKDILDELVLHKKKPVLGICLGFQLLSNSSEEGGVDGLGWVNTRTVRYSFTEKNKLLKIPHVGWDTISLKNKSILFKDVPENERYYFTHSYIMSEVESDVCIATNDYGQDSIAVLERENIFGTQFHPEKSRLHGLKIIDNFIRFTQ
jgi:glutamine amidotransferase